MRSDRAFGRNKSRSAMRLTVLDGVPVVNITGTTYGTTRGRFSLGSLRHNLLLGLMTRLQPSSARRNALRRPDHVRQLRVCIKVPIGMRGRPGCPPGGPPRALSRWRFCLSALPKAMPVRRLPGGLLLPGGPPRFLSRYLLARSAIVRAMFCPRNSATERRIAKVVQPASQLALVARKTSLLSLVPALLHGVTQLRIT